MKKIILIILFPVVVILALLIATSEGLVKIIYKACDVDYPKDLFGR